MSRKNTLLILTIICAIFVLAMSACQLGQTQPKLEWETSPQAVLIKHTDPIQFPGLLPTWQDERMENYLPEGVVFGDGRVQWVGYFYGGEITSRQVFEGFLEPEQVRGLLERFVDSGFFSWKDQYSGSFREDGPPSQVLTVNLHEQTKSVVVNNAQPPQGFQELAKLISTGAGAIGHEYVPGQAFFCAYLKMMDWNEEQSIQVIRWPAEQAGFTLAELEETGGVFPGRYIDGQILSFAWQVINANPQSPLVEDNRKIYLITLQFPELSMYDLPDP